MTLTVRSLLRHRCTFVPAQIWGTRKSEERNFMKNNGISRPAHTHLIGESFSLCGAHVRNIFILLRADDLFKRFKVHTSLWIINFERRERANDFRRTDYAQYPLEPFVLKNWRAHNNANAIQLSAAFTMKFVPTQNVLLVHTQLGSGKCKCKGINTHTPHAAHIHRNPICSFRAQRFNIRFDSLCRCLFNRCHQHTQPNQIAIQ